MLFCSQSLGSSKENRFRSNSRSENEDDIPEWKKERSFTPEDEMKPRKWRAAESSRSDKHRYWAISCFLGYSGFY